MILSFPHDSLLEYSEILRYNFQSYKVNLIGVSMALLNILQFPDPRLKNKAEPVSQFDEALAQHVDNMLETMYEAQGVGLAAIQVNLAQHILVMDVSSSNQQPRHFINLTIVGKEGLTQSQEGCLSFPGVYATVERAKAVQVEYQDIEGKSHQLEADGLLAICLQHELDHLNGITFYDHLSPLKQSLLRKKMAKYRKRAL